MVDEGLVQINKLLATSETPYYLYVKGILLYEKKQYDDAIATFNKIISNNGDLVAEAYGVVITSASSGKPNACNASSRDTKVSHL